MIAISDTHVIGADAIFPESLQFPLGRPFDEIVSSADVCSASDVRPFGLRFATDTANVTPVDRSQIGYDPDRQVGIVRQGDVVVPLFKHSTVTTNTRTSDGHQSMDSDTDATED